MSTYLNICEQNMGISSSHIWNRHSLDASRWIVSGLDDFCVSGFAVVDDFGNLVRVPA